MNTEAAVRLSILSVRVTSLWIKPATHVFMKQKKNLISILFINSFASLQVALNIGTGLELNLHVSS